MRADMHEVIIERPRWAHRLRYPRARVLHRTRVRSEDALPARESMGGFYAEKSLSDNLAPLVRYLRSQVGRPWAKVSSEIAARLSANSAVQKHVMDHLREYVVERVHEDAEGRVWGAGRYGRPAPPRFFFVHPRSGVLAENPTPPRKKKSRARIVRPDVHVVSATLQLRRVRGVWYAVSIAELPPLRGPGSVAVVRDAIAKVDPRKVGYLQEHEAMRDLWQDRRYAQSLRQLSKREIRTLLG